MNRILTAVTIFFLLIGLISCSSENAGTENNNPWEKQWGSGSIDKARSIAIDSSSNILVFGNTSGSFYGEWIGGYFDMFLVKFDSDGNELWSKQWGTIFGDEARVVAVDSEDNIIATGISGGSGENSEIPDSIMFLTKFDTSGNNLWTKNFGPDDKLFPHSVTVDKENNIFVAGYYLERGMAVLLKFNKEGNKLWEKQFCTPNTWNEARAVTLDSKGNAFVTGTTGGDIEDNIPDKEKMFIIKFNKDGDQLWVQTFDYMDTGIALAVDSFDSVISIGNDGYDAYLTKFDSGGNKIWEISQNISLTLLYPDRSGNILAAGSSSIHKPFIIKYDNEGNILWTDEFDFENKPYGYISSISNDSSDNTFVVGNTGNGFRDKNKDMPEIFLKKYPLQNMSEQTIE